MLKVITGKKGALKWAAIVFIAILALTVFNLNNAAEVRIETVKRGNMKDTIELQGRVELENSEKIYAKLEGLINEVNVNEGDEVKAGTKLLQLSVDDLEFAISKAQAAYNASKSQLESLKSSIKPEQVRIAEAQLEQAKAAETTAMQDYMNRKDSFEKTKALYDNGALSEKDLKDAEAAFIAVESGFRNSEQAVIIAQLTLDVLKDGVSKDQIEVLEANVAAAKVQVDELISNKGKTNIYAPTSGFVLEKGVENGQAVLPGVFLYEIGDYDSACIRVDVLVDDIYKIKEGQKAVISGDLVNDAEIQGEVYYIAPKAESKVSSLGVEQQRIEVKISFDNSSLMLKPGYTLDVDIVTKEKPDTIYVSDKSVFEMDGKDSVFVVSNSKLEIRAIETGIENDDFIEVLSGITEGEKIVVDPDNELKTGKRVKYKK